MRERDGFELAEVDLELRGEGEVLGTRQSGLPRFRVACLPEDAGLLLAAREDLIALLDEHGSLEAPALGPLIDAVRARFGDERAEPIAGMRVDRRVSSAGAGCGRRAAELVRPTSDRVREALFSILGDVEGMTRPRPLLRDRRARRSRRSPAAPRERRSSTRRSARSSATSPTSGSATAAEVVRATRSPFLERDGADLRPRASATRPIDSPAAWPRPRQPARPPHRGGCARDRRDRRRRADRAAARCRCSTSASTGRP